MNLLAFLRQGSAFPMLLVCASLPVFAEPANLVRNGNMEAPPRVTDNLLDGIDAQGRFKAGSISVPVLGASGGLAKRKVPCSVALHDVNRDGKTDIVAALPEGYYYVYFNSGDATAPKFTHAEILPLFLSAPDYAENEFVGENIHYDKRVPRIGLGDWSGTGAVDLVIGNLFGQLFMIKAGRNSSEGVTFSMPRSFDAAEITTTRVKGRYWGNLFSPQIVDWDGDGRKDIVLGEGSYSANSVFLLRTENVRTPPQYQEKDRYYLMTGDGREQLVPAVADYNGDGLLDLLVADREGRVSVHLRPESWKLGDVLPLASFLSIGGKDRLGAAITIGAGDYNQDGLFDLIIGESDGSMAIALNSGTRTEPLFERLESLRGTDVWSDNIAYPPSWGFYDAGERGNALGYARVVTADVDPQAQPPEGTRCLRLGNLTPLNRIVIPSPTPTMARKDIAFRLNQNVTLDVGAKYVLEAKIKGTKVSGLSMTLSATAQGKIPVNVKTDDRGGVIGNVSRAKEDWTESKKASPGSQWSTFSYTFTPRLQNKELDHIKKLGAELRISMGMPDENSSLYLDDVKLYRVEE